MENLQQLVKRYLNKETPFEELENSGKHEVLWKWLSENPVHEKNDFFEKFNAQDVSGDCYACEDMYRRDGKCPSGCPINWLDFYGIQTNGCIRCSEYGRWCKSENLSERSELAKIIAEKEWN